MMPDRDMLPSRLEAELHAALTAANDQAVPAVERAEMLMEIAIGLQQRPKTPDHLTGAVALYDRALSVCPECEKLLRARLLARRGTALQAMPDDGMDSIEAARVAYETAIPTLAELGMRAEIAEVEMNLGLVLQYLAGAGRARIVDAIAAYQRALRTFDRARYPAEFAILQNNLATAFLSMPLVDERAKMREALAVQAFEEGLKVVTLIDHPAEYAMLQNNLGNALQYASSAHAIENNLRAMEAYDEALKVRTRATAPLEYANTIANKANCLMNLPDSPDDPAGGNHANLARAKRYLEEAQAIFVQHGDLAKVQIVAEPLAELRHQMALAG
jgi:tetratricopeptide (TPR) repeat protein